ncbi:MAG TPA: LysE family translocator, partial [Noviherbaspirillum sp.]
MFGIHDFGVFLATSIVLNLTPGTDTFYILGRTLSQGRNAGIASALGIASGALVHTLAAALGLSALLAASATAFLVIRLAGAGYLVYLGVRMLLTRQPPASLATGLPSARLSEVYRQGLLTNVLNPKVALFFLAFLPQFIPADGGSTYPAFMLLGLCFVFTSALWCLCLVWCASGLRRLLHGDETIVTVLHRAAGVLFIGLGLRLAASR